MTPYAGMTRVKFVGRRERIARGLSGVSMRHGRVETPPQSLFLFHGRLMESNTNAVLNSQANTERGIPQPRVLPCQNTTRPRSPSTRAVDSRLATTTTATAAITRSVR